MSDQQRISDILGSTREPAESDVVEQYVRGKGKTQAKHWLHEIADGKLSLELLTQPWLVNHAGRQWTFATNGRVAVMVVGALEGVVPATGKPLGTINVLRGYGNAVVPQVAEWIGRRIIEAYESASVGDGEESDG